MNSKETVSAFAGQVEISVYNEDGQVAGRGVKTVKALEADMPPEMRQWLLERAPVKEG